MRVQLQLRAEEGLRKGAATMARNIVRNTAGDMMETVTRMLTECPTQHLASLVWPRTKS